MEKTLFSTPELAEWLGVFHTTVRRWIEGGRIKGIRVGRNYKIPADEVIRILEGHGIPLPEIVMKYKSNRQNARQRPVGYSGYQGSILQKLLVVDKVPDPAFICRNKAILGTNQAFADLVGYAQEDLLGCDIADVVKEPPSEKIAEFGKRRIETPYRGPADYVAHLKTGKNVGKEVSVTADALDGLKDIYLMVVKTSDSR